MKRLVPLIVMFLFTSAFSYALVNDPKGSANAKSTSESNDRQEMLKQLGKLENQSKEIRQTAMVKLIEFGPDLELILPELVQIAKKSEDKKNSEVVVSLCLDFIGEQADLALCEALRESQDEDERSNLIRMICLLLDRPIPTVLRELKAADSREYYQDLCIILISCGYGHKAIMPMIRIAEISKDKAKAGFIIKVIEMIKAQPSPPNKYPK